MHASMSRVCTRVGGHCLKVYGAGVCVCVCVCVLELWLAEILSANITDVESVEGSGLALEPYFMNASAWKF